MSKKKPSTKTHLTEAIEAAWNQVIEKKELQKLVDTMPKRCRMVIANKGWPIKY